MRRINIAGLNVGDGCEPFIVAEVGMNHNGSVERAVEMIGAARQSGCDAVKFGTFKAAEFCAPDDPLYDTFKRCELPDWAWYELRREAQRQGIVFFSTPQNETDMRLLVDVGVPCLKIGSDDMSNTALINVYAKTGLPIILSTGMAFEHEVVEAVEAVGKNPLIVCACTSEYPCPPEHANLARIDLLAAMFPSVLIGFSDHTIGPQAATVAACLDACYFEKHFTMDNALPGPDHAFSANPEQLANWAWSIRNVATLLGDGQIKPSEQELINGAKWRRASGQRIRGRDERNAAQVS